MLFLLLGGGVFPQNMEKTKYLFIYQEEFLDTNFDLWKQPLQFFLRFSIFVFIFFNTKIILIFLRSLYSFLQNINIYVLWV